MSRIVVEIPEEIGAALRLPGVDAERELREELAVALYRREALSFGKARQLAGMDRLGFGRLLTRHGVPRHYSEENLAEDLEYAGLSQ